MKKIIERIKIWVSIIHFSLPLLFSKLGVIIEAKIFTPYDMVINMQRKFLRQLYCNDNGT